MSAIIQTHSGHFIDLMHPDPYAISINDIAYALSHICRFGGHVKEFYSVANHSVLVALNVPAEDAMAGLMHDATEAYCGDVVGPLKAILPAYKDIEAGLWEAIAWRYRLPDELPASVLHADKALLATEMRDLTYSYRCNDYATNCLQGVQPLVGRINPLSITASRSAFLKQFHALKEASRGKK